MSDIEAEILWLGEQVRGVMGQAPPDVEALVTDLLRVPWPRRLLFFRDVAPFMAERMFATGALGPDLVASSNKLAFMWSSIDPQSALSAALAGVSRRAFRTTGGVLSPYLEEGDIAELVRWRLWGLEPAYFHERKILGAGRLLPFVGTLARNIARDELRKLARRPLLVGDDRASGDRTPAASALDADDRLVLSEEVAEAAERALGDQPEALKSIALAALIEHEERSSLLDAANRVREALGQPPWSMNAFNGYVFRLRKKMREALVARG